MKPTLSGASSAKARRPPVASARAPTPAVASNCRRETPEPVATDFTALDITFLPEQDADRPRKFPDRRAPFRVVHCSPKFRLLGNRLLERNQRTETAGM